MDSKFATALLLQSWTVYGYRLKPFCLLHSARLEGIESPVVCEGEITDRDILRAAQICAVHWEYPDLKRTLRHRWFFNHGHEAAKLMAYIEESKATFDLYDAGESSGRSSLRAPSQLVVAVALTARSITWDQAWTMPEGLALSTFYAIGEQDSGKSQIYSEDEQREDEELKRINEEMQPVHDRRIANLMLRQAGKWPKDIPWDIDAELPQEVSNG